MYKKIWIASLVLAAAVAGFTSCKSDTDQAPTPRVILSAGRSTPSAVNFTLSALDAQQVAYKVVKSGETLPGAADILTGGLPADPMRTALYTQAELEPATAYTIVAVAHASGLTSAVVSVQMTTPSAQNWPSVTLEAGEATASSLTFTLTPDNADKAAYLCLSRCEPSPAPEVILANGIEANAAAPGQYTVKGLDMQVGYRIVAAALHNGQVSELAAIDMQTAGGRLWSVGEVYDVNGVKGLVFKVSEGGRYGLILSLEEAPTVSNYSHFIEYNGTGFDDSATNMALIQQFEDWETAFPAFKYCNDLNKNGERIGWVLPAFDEMVDLYKVFNGGVTEPVNPEAKVAFNKLLIDAGGTPFTPELYWTSTEYATRQQYHAALAFNFQYYSPYYHTMKTMEYKVRAIRRF